MIEKIAILGAMPEEIELVVAELEHVEKELIAGVTFYKGKKEGKHIVACCAGMGKANAASVTQLLITHFKVEAVVFSGIAGNMSDKIGIGDIVISETLCYHDAEDRMLAQSAPHTSLYTASDHLIQAARYGCEAVGANYIVGKIATGDQFVGDAVIKKSIQEKCHPDCVEMEGASVAQVSMRNEIPFVVLRAMSDNSDTSIEVLGAESFDIEEYVKTASAIVLAMISSI